MLKVTPVLCRAGSMDNYSYILQDKETGISAVVDPSEAPTIIAACNKLNLKPQYIFNTHHHFDHTDGNLAVKEAFNAKVVGNTADAHRIPGIDITVEAGKTFALGKSIAEIIDVSAHTQGHILWYFPQDKIVFTGDTLFNLSIGGLFEGTPAQMYEALAEIKKLPDDTLFYPGHEYTLHGLRDMLNFCSDAKAAEEYAKLAENRLKQGLSVAPVTLGLEKKCNPYLQVQSQQEFENMFGM